MALPIDGNTIVVETIACNGGPLHGNRMYDEGPDVLVPVARLENGNWVIRNCRYIKNVAFTDKGMLSLYRWAGEE